MKIALRIAVAGLASLALFFAGDASARRGGGHFHHHHHSRVVFSSGFWFGPPYWYPPPYYYGPDWSVAHAEPPPVYVEKFDGTPRADGTIFCPDAGAYYPDVNACPNGWQHVMRP